MNRFRSMFRARASSATSRALLIVVAAIATAALLLCAGCFRSEKRPNIVLVVLDTVRRDVATPDSLDAVEAMPALDSLGRDGTIFTNAWSTSPWTPPSHATMMTGLLSSEHWCTTRNTRLSGKVKTLPDYLVPQGYEAVAFHSNPWLTEGLSGILRSFQTHYVDSQGDSRTHAAGGSQGGAENNRNIAEWLDTRDGDKPFLLFVNYLEAHLPYDPSAEVRAAQLPDLPRDDYVSVQWAFEFNAGLHPSGDVDWTRVRRLYQGDASTADALLGDLMQMLKERGLYENSVIIVTSDHGENLGDHGLMDHQFGLFESLLAVPLVVRAPGMLDQGVRNDPVMLSDVFPSILEAAGMTDVPSLPHARSLFGPPAPPDRPLIAQYAGGSPGLVELLWRMNPKLETAHLLTPYSSIRIGDLRLTVGNDGSNLLQDFSRNRASSRDLRNDSREIAERMKSELPTFVAPVGDTQIGEHMRETLRSLGYLP